MPPKLYFIETGATKIIITEPIQENQSFKKAFLRNRLNFSLKHKYDNNPKLKRIFFFSLQ